MTTTETPQSWAQAVLAGIGAPDTPSNEKALEDWAAAEGGAGPQWGIANNVDNFNPLNTTLPEPGASSTNAAGVKSYRSWSQGIAATVSTLLGGGYGNVVADFKASAPETQVSADVGASAWGTPNWDPGGTPQATAQLTSLNINPFDLFGIPQTIGGNVASGVWSLIGPFLVKGVLVVFGLGLILLGAMRATGRKGPELSDIAPVVAGT